MTILDYKLPWCEPSELKDALQILRDSYASWASLGELRVLSNLTYDTNSAYMDEISEELSNHEVVAVVLEEKEPSKRVLQLQDQIKIYQDKLTNYMDAIVTSLASRTSKYTKCPTCGSHVSVAHIKNANCPVCDSPELLMTNTHHKRINGYKAFIETLNARLAEATASSRSRVVSKSWLIVGKVA